MIDVRELEKRHGEIEVLRGITLSVAKGEVAAIIGPSGGGKSTFLRCLNGLELFDSGSIAIGDAELTAELGSRERAERLRRIRSHVGMVFQQFHLFPHMSVIENVTEAPTQVLGRSLDEARARAAKLLERVGLASKADRKPSSLSGGEQQRVAIARALAMSPDVMLFDEPTSALDPSMTREVLAVIADLARDGLTMLVVTHAMEFARRAANTVHVFQAGRVLESGPPSQIFEAPREPATKAFLELGG